MKALFIGGVKSGKSLHAEEFTQTIATDSIYLATSEVFDGEMSERVQKHKIQRSDNFTTIEESLDIYKILKQQSKPVLVECMTLWINNMLYHDKEKEIYKEIEKILKLKNDMVFVLNDVGTGIIPNNALARKFVDISGIVAQMIAKDCDEVYHCIAGLKQRIK